MKRILAFLPLLALVGIAIMLGVSNFTKSSHFEPRAMIGKPLPDLTLTDLEGGPDLSLKTVKGPIIINLFASWCVPEMPVLASLKSSGVRIIGIAYQDSPQKSLAFLEQTTNPYAQVLNDPKGASGLELGISGVPETYLIDAHGVITDKISAPLTETDISRIKAAMGVPAQP